MTARIIRLGTPGMRDEGPRFGTSTCEPRTALKGMLIGHHLAATRARITMYMHMFLNSDI